MENNTIEIIENYKKANRIEDAVFFCKEKLKGEENRICLRFLADYYSETDDKKSARIFLERLMNCEVKKADIVLRLLKIRGKSNELMETAVDELISEKREEEASDIFFKLVEDNWFEHEKILKWAERLSNHGKSKIAYDWISRVIEIYKNSSLWDEMESILSFCWKINPCDEVKKNLLLCLREKYREYPHLEYYIEEMNFHSRKDIPSVLNKLDEILKYDEGRWVYHDSWGLGLIKEMIPYLDEIVIDFDGNKGHSMNLKGAERIIRPLPEDHWAVLTKTQKNKLLNMIKEDPVSLVKIFLKSAGGKA
ncbi:hypothetical protein JXA84_06135, partial [candidate division WOR-3 bacterium]|nr:hypothetical protein [candidate division WOR-3 bacterium]